MKLDPRLLGLFLVGLILVLGGGILLHGRSDQPMTISSAQATQIVTQSQKSLTDVQIGETPQTGVVAAHGVALVPLPTASLASARRGASGTPTAPTPVVDNLHGIAGVALPGSTSLAAIPRGSTASLHPGDQLVIVGAAQQSSVIVSYVGIQTVRLGNSGFGQNLLDLTLPSGTQVSQGAVVDNQGRLVGIVAPNRQNGAPASHLYAVPIEQADSLLQQLAATPAPSPTSR